MIAFERSSTLQVEARLRQLEGKALATDGAGARGKEQASKYDKAKADGGALAAPTKAYNADADVQMPDKKVRAGIWVCGGQWGARGADDGVIYADATTRRRSR